MTNDNYSKTMDCLLAKFTWDRKVKEVNPVTMNVQDFYLKNIIMKYNFMMSLGYYK